MARWRRATCQLDDGFAPREETPQLNRVRVTFISHDSQFLQKFSTRAEAVGVFARPGSNPDYGFSARMSPSAECRHWSARAVRWSNLTTFSASRRAVAPKGLPAAKD